MFFIEITVIASKESDWKILSIDFFFLFDFDEF